MQEDDPLPPKRVAMTMCAAHVLSMTGFGTFAALMPGLIIAWRMTNAEAGTISGVYYAGYMSAVPFLTGMTDRVDARRVYLVACVLLCGTACGFALFARDFWSALLLQGLAGAGLAGTYMPGLKILSDRIATSRQSRWIGIYTSTFGVGAALSLWMAGTIAATLNWRWSFAIASVGPVIAAFLVFLLLSERKPALTAGANAGLFDFKAVFRNHAVRGYILAYAGHCWELFGFRSWIVAFFSFAALMRAPTDTILLNAATLAAAINLAGPGASILGNEIATRWKRTRTISATMKLSAALACIVGFLAPLPGTVVFATACFYFLAIMGDSAALTAGLLLAAESHQRGAAMAVHSFLGFGAAFIAPVIFGSLLDLAGGNRSVVAWGIAFISLGAGSAFGSLMLAIHRNAPYRITRGLP